MQEQKNKNVYGICVLCKKEFLGYGHNARPVKNGLCCDACNILVIARRMLDVRKLSR